MEVKVRIKGINHTVHRLARTNNDVFNACKEGTEDCAYYVMEKIKKKFGRYQSTGGDPNGRGKWKKLSEKTILKKHGGRVGGPDNPLIGETGKMKDSFSVVAGGKGRLAASVGSDSKYLIHHIYGAPRANVPQRDPFRVTAEEEADKCTELLMDIIEEALGG